MSNHKPLSEKEFNKLSNKLEKMDSKIKTVEDLLFKTDENGNKYMIPNPSTQYLLSKLKPLLKERESIYNRMYPYGNNEELNNYLD